MFGNIFKFFTIRGVPYGQKVTRRRKKGGTNFQKKNLKYWTKWNKKMGGRSFVTTSGVIGTLYCAVPHTAVLHGCGVEEVQLLCSFLPWS